MKFKGLGRKRPLPLFTLRKNEKNHVNIGQEITVLEPGSRLPVYQLRTDLSKVLQITGLVADEWSGNASAARDFCVQCVPGRKVKGDAPEPRLGISSCLRRVGMFVTVHEAYERKRREQTAALDCFATEPLVGTSYSKSSDETNKTLLFCTLSLFRNLLWIKLSLLPVRMVWTKTNNYASTAT